MKSKDLYWVAGILEGEGNFDWDGIRCSMVDQDIIQRLADLTGGTINGPYNWDSNRLPMYRYYIGGFESYMLMKGIYPIMGERRQAQIKTATDNRFKRTVFREAHKAYTYLRTRLKIGVYITPCVNCGEWLGWRQRTAPRFSCCRGLPNEC